ncbi:uncharacterized protein LOC113464042 [Ceratina calcarata]|uniref:Regulatory protein zeste n=1 Tax=Ceratina calcarata TaxID=156304 RepID=A0AAJ7RY99_9HYME|nr:uncharacterized protein LOC113464042 [Ceratina calcarata]
MPRNLLEVDRRKSQFDKEERVHLLAIMKRYAPLLDSSASTLARKNIWTTIENEFKKAGFTQKTSAQLKKYWQNYKYHCKKATAHGKENKRYIDSMVSESLEWNRYPILVEKGSVSKFSEIPGLLRPLTDHPPTESGYQLTESYRDNGASQKSNNSDVIAELPRIKMEKEDEIMSDDHKTENSNVSENENIEEDTEETKENLSNEDHLVSSSTNESDIKSKNRIVVSNAKISNNSVTVSVIYPENRQLPRDELDAPSVPTRRLVDACPNTLGNQPTPFEYPPNTSQINLNEISKNRINVTNILVKDQTNSYLNSNNRCIKIHKLRNLLRYLKFIDYERYKSFERTGSIDLPREKEIEEFLVEEQNEKDEAKGIDTRNDRFDPRGYVFLTDYHNRLKHRLILQQLETEEKRLKVKIAELAVQEAQLRIKALHEDMRRTEELHQVRLVQTAGNVNNFSF